MWTIVVSCLISWFSQKCYSSHAIINSPVMVFRLAEKMQQKKRFKPNIGKCACSFGNVGQTWAATGYTLAIL